MEEEKRAFSIMEIFTVVIILGILSAIVVPKFSQAGNEARLTYMVGDLQKMRAQIELYRIQHDDLLPGQKVAGGSISEYDFVRALTSKSDEGLGPYVEKIPANPFNDLNTVSFGTRDTRDATGAGWFLNVRTGKFRADDTNVHLGF